MAENKNVRKLALSLLCEYEELGKYVNLSLASHKADGLSREERSTLTALLYTSVEHKLTYDYYICAISGRSIDKIDPVTKNILRLGMCQLLDMDSVPDFAAVNETVALARNKGERAFVNGVLRAAQRARGSLPLPDRSKNPARYLSVKYSFPLWIVKKFISEYGEVTTEKLLSHMSDIAPTDLTVNTLKISRAEFVKKLSDLGYDARESSLSPYSVRIASSVDPRILPGYSEGEFFVQDAACSAAVYTLGAESGELLIDTCACPGGKSFAAAIMMNNRGRVKSFDIHESKLSLVSDGASRLSLDIVEPEKRDAVCPMPELISKADRVICDVPCSGLGVLRKKPDLRYKSEAGADELPRLQYEILTASSKYLRCGGRMIYSTCTLSAEENEGVVEAFLSENRGFRAVDFKIGGESSRNGCFTFLPHIHNTDGFFVSLIERDS